MAKILVADDEPDLRDALRRVCEGDGHEVLVAADGRAAVDAARSARPDLIVLDNRMPIMSGLDALAEIRDFDPVVTVVLFTAYDDAADVRRAVLELRAFDYLIKGSGVEGVRQTIRDALRSRGFSPGSAPVEEEPEQDVGFQQMVGLSRPMQTIYELIRKVAHSDVTVLIQGESGTGKELVASAIHDTSRRRDQAYVTVDCGTLPDTLTESEIFGHEAGAFTDARKSRPGKLELADGGSLFLDEIGNLSHGAQAKLLRVLEDKRVTRLGGQDVKVVDVRVVAATNLDLARASADKTFREDLYYRLNVFKFELPPLRDRKEDLPLLATHFTRRFVEEQGRAPLELTPSALDAMQEHDWPGNVRELRNVMERAVLLAGDEIRPEHLSPEMTGAAGVAPTRSAPDPSTGTAEPASTGPSVSSEGTEAGAMVPEGSLVLPPVDLDAVSLKEAKRLAGDQVERAYLLAALRRTGWNKSKAAQVLGLNYKTLREKIRDLDLDRLRYQD
ncbi:MAG: sigma-54 dependent transcriptional regulator [Acidobacteriota bacterium]